MKSLICDLYAVVRTDKSKSPWLRRALSYAPSDYMTAMRRADYYQQTFDPACQRFDYRVEMVG